MLQDRLVINLDEDDDDNIYLSSEEPADDYHNASSIEIIADT